MVKIGKQKTTDPNVLATWVKKFKSETRSNALPGKLIHHLDKPDGVLLF
jgi:hypothetical protein